MKKWLLIGAGVFAFILIAASLFVVSNLPSRSEIVSAVTREKSEEPETTAAAVPSASVPAPQAESSAAPAEEAAKAEKKKKELKQILSLMEEDFRDIRVCDHLGTSRMDPKKPSLEFADIFGEERGDSLTEAYRAPLKAIFQEPHVSALFHELQTLDPELDGKSKTEKDGLFEKIGFYSRVAQAGLALREKKEHFENLGDRAVHLSVLAKIALLKPELKDSTALVDYCRTIENPETVTDRAALSDERKKIVDLIAQSGLKPSDLDFDPSDWVRFSVESDRNGMRVSLKGKDDAKEAVPSKN